MLFAFFDIVANGPQAFVNFAFTKKVLLRNEIELDLIKMSRLYSKICHSVIANKPSRKPPLLKKLNFSITNWPADLFSKQLNMFSKNTLVFSQVTPSKAKDRTQIFAHTYLATSANQKSNYTAGF